MDKLPPVASLCKNLVALFTEVQILSRQTNITIIDQISLQESRDRLILWSDGYGVTDGCLDNTLSHQRTTRLHKAVIKTLSHMADVLIERLIPSLGISSTKLIDLCKAIQAGSQDASEKLPPDEDSDSASETGSSFIENGIHEIVKDLESDNDVLMHYDPLFKSLKD
ncbi:hypothetical protein GGI35DRAFT_464934 [Trichoderma velutinum]